MRNLLIKQGTISPESVQFGMRSPHHRGRLRAHFMELERQHRFQRMAERVYGVPGAADALLLKTLCLSQAMAFSQENFAGEECAAG